MALLFISFLQNKQSKATFDSGLIFAGGAKNTHRARALAQHRFFRNSEEAVNFIVFS